MPNIFDLEERTARFSESIIDFIRKIQLTPLNKSILSQIIRSGTSVGANYCEANESESKKDFIHKISICKKECKETRYWLRLILKTNPEFKEIISQVWKENQELLLIFSKIIVSTKNKN
ncbi:MAG: four helix bundle protein [Candidatus Roizmanbacteria bacterium]